MTLILISYKMSFTLMMGLIDFYSFKWEFSPALKFFSLAEVISFKVQTELWFFKKFSLLEFRFSAHLLNFETEDLHFLLSSLRLNLDDLMAIVSVCSRNCCKLFSDAIYCFDFLILVDKPLTIFQCLSCFDLKNSNIPRFDNSYD